MRMELQPIFEEIDFVERYKRICNEHNDLENSMRGNNKKLYEEILSRIGFPYKYFSNGSFFKISEGNVNLHLVLKDGLIEPLLYIMKNGNSLLPRGRFDGIAEELQPGFREQYTIPKYTSEQELEQILREIFSIYEEIKREVLKAGESPRCS